MKSTFRLTFSHRSLGFRLDTFPGSVRPLRQTAGLTSAQCTPSQIVISVCALQSNFIPTVRTASEF
jgi:hypothetical protein